MNFYNSKEIVSMLSAPPFSFNRPGTVQVVVESNESVKLIGAGEYVEEAVRSLTDPKSSHMKYFARHKTFFKASKIVAESTGHSAILLIGSRRKW